MLSDSEVLGTGGEPSPWERNADGSGERAGKAPYNWLVNPSGDPAGDAPGP
jgi:hypothetical protein